MTVPNDNEIRSHPCPDCYLCGTKGKLLYQALQDRLFGASGIWTIKKCSNEACGLLWLDPMPVPEDLGNLYTNYYTHKDAPVRNSILRRLYERVISGYLSLRYGYLRQHSLDCVLGLLLYLHPGRCADADARVMHLPAMPGGRLIEVGCGTGQALKRLQELGWDVEGLDFDPVVVEKARAKGLNVKLGHLSAQEYPAGCFDAVVMSHVIEHVPDPVAFFRECHRVLRPGGRIVAYTPNASAWGHKHYGVDWRGLEPPRHLHVFTPQALCGTARQAGFDEATCLSTIRGIGILQLSYMQRRHGKGDIMVSRLVTRWLWVEMAYFWEWAVCKVNKNAGEEIMLMAIKQ